MGIKGVFKGVRCDSGVPRNFRGCLGISEEYSQNSSQEHLRDFKGYQETSGAF